MIIDAFKNKIFPMVPTGFSEDDVDEDELLKKRREEDGKLPTIEEELEDEIPDTSTSEQMSRLDKIYAPLIRKYFMENSLIKIMKKLREYKENPAKLQMYNNLMVHLNIGLENDIKNMSEDKVQEKKHLDYLKSLVRAIIDAGQKYGMSDLETEEEAEKRQRGQELKILTPKQMITRLPILLAQLKEGNNSQKLKEEIRQIAYSLYRSKNLSKQSIII